MLEFTTRLVRVRAPVDPLPPDLEQLFQAELSTQIQSLLREQEERLFFGRPVTGVTIIDGQAVEVLPESRQLPGRSTPDGP